jgi:uncharacterized protein YidB (DUF937 family)
MALLDGLLGALTGAMGGQQNARAANPLLEIMLQMLAGQAGGARGPAGPGGAGGLGDLLNRMGGQQAGPGPGAGGLGDILGRLGAQAGGQAGGPGAGHGAPPMGGLGDLLEAFRRNGLSDKADSWVGTGPNKSISAEEIERTLGIDRVGEVARQAGVQPREAANGMAVGLPELIDKLTPRGQVPQGGVGDLAAIMEALGIRR